MPICFVLATCPNKINGVMQPCFSDMDNLSADVDNIIFVGVDHFADVDMTFTYG